MRGTVAALLRQAGPQVGGWRSGGGGGGGDLEGDLDLECFEVSGGALARGGGGATAAEQLTNLVASDEALLRAFDSFVAASVIPHLKGRLVAADAAEADKPLTFHVQRPPTLRLQPGPSTFTVRPHRDAEYGHQPGELNFWLPLTDVARTRTTLWAESAPGAADDQPLDATLGEAVAFFGTGCRHHVPANPSDCTRVSLDFRVGVEGHFDPKWSMRGTRADHSRAQVTL